MLPKKTRTKADLQAHAARIRQIGIEKGRLGGRVKGFITAATIEKRKEEAAVNSVLLSRAKEIAAAQLMPALGQQYIFKLEEEINDKGKIISREHVQVDDPSEIASALGFIAAGGVDPQGVYYYITTKEPDWRAAEAIFNRIFGKAREQVDVNVEHSFSLSSLLEARKQLELDRGDIAIQVSHTEIDPP